MATDITFIGTHDGGGATGWCVSSGYGAPTYSAAAPVGTNYLPTVPNAGGGPVLIHLWTASSASSGAVGVLTSLYLNDADVLSVELSVLPDLGLLSLENNLLSAEMLDSIFEQLEAEPPGYGEVDVSGNPGAATCDPSIATAKGWTVTTA